MGNDSAGQRSSFFSFHRDLSDAEELIFVSNATFEIFADSTSTIHSTHNPAKRTPSSVSDKPAAAAGWDPFGLAVTRWL